MSDTKFQNTKKGISLYLSMTIMSILLAIALGVSTILFGQLKMIRGMGDSVVAFYAADTGIEEVLMNRENPSSSCTEISPCALDNGAEYYIGIISPGPNCQAANFCIESAGSYQETQRAIEATY